MGAYGRKRGFDSSSDDEAYRPTRKSNKRQKATPRAKSKRRTSPTSSHPPTRTLRRSTRIAKLKNAMAENQHPPSPPAAETPVSPTMKTPEGEEPAADSEPDAPMTEADLFALFPGSHFDTTGRILAKGYWSLAAETQMRQTYASFTARTARKTGLPASELHIFQALALRFACTPADLFRYGLKPPPDLPAHALVPWCLRLATLLAHPIWHGRVALVRWALQVAIAVRCAAGHPEPLRPPYSGAAHPFVRVAGEWARARGEDARREHAQMNDWFFASNVPWPVQQLVHETLRTHGVRAEGAGGRADEVVFFYVTEGDLEFVLEAMVTQVGDAEGVYKTPATYYSELLAEVEWDGHKGWDAEWMAGLKEEWLFAMLREAAVRNAMVRKGEGDLLLDIPPCDPDPLYHLNEAARAGLYADGAYGTAPYAVTRRQLASFDGSLVGTPAALLWCWLGSASG